MAIIVTCPGCRKSFSVDDKFGGRTGPCPKCKTSIQIPLPGKGVKVHGGEAFSDGGRSASGELVLKPIKRREVKFHPLTAALIVIGTLVTYFAAYMLGSALHDSTILCVIGLVLVTVPLVYAPYTFLRNAEEIESFSVREQIIRTAACAGSYVLLWGGYLFMARFAIPAMGYSGINWILLAIPFCIMAVLLAASLYNLEWGDGVVHLVFYLVFTLSLCYVGNVDFISPVVDAPLATTESGAKIPPPPPPGG